MTEEQILKAFEGRWRIKSHRLKEALEMMLIEYRVDYVKKLCIDFFRTGILLASPSPSPRALPSGSPEGKTPIELRAEAFYQQVHSPEYTSKYPEQLLADFFSYWSEPNKSKTKMRFELQKTWDTTRRLATWARNDFNHYGNSTNNDNREKLATVLAP